MNLLIISNVEHYTTDGGVWGSRPVVRETGRIAALFRKEKFRLNRGMGGRLELYNIMVAD